MTLSQDLTILEVAQERALSAMERLERAQFPYQRAIETLQEAMETDGNVLQAIQVVDEYRDLYKQALEKAESTAIQMWEQGETNGRKEWTEGNWEVRLRTTKTPIVESLVEFVRHVTSLNVIGSTIKRVTLHRAVTVGLHEKQDNGGIEGLTVEEKTTCSLRRRDG